MRCSGKTIVALGGEIKSRGTRVARGLWCGLTNQANRPRADGAPAPPASGPVERDVRRAHGEWRPARSWRENVSPHVEQRYFSTKKSKIAMPASSSTRRATTATEVDGPKLRSDAAT